MKLFLKIILFFLFNAGITASAMKPADYYVVFDRYIFSSALRQTGNCLSTLAGVCSVLSVFELCRMAYYKEKIIGLEGAFMAFGALFCFIVSFKGEDPDEIYATDCGDDSAQPARDRKSPYKSLYALELLMHNLQPEKINNPWKYLTLKEVVQLESLSSKKFAENLSKFKRITPPFLSWFIPSYGIAQTFIIDNQKYPLYQPVQQNFMMSFLQKQLIKKVLPCLQQERSVYKKIEKELSKKMLLYRLINSDDFNTIGDFSKLPIELRVCIAEYCKNAVPITRKEFFVDFLPYLEIRRKSRNLVYDYECVDQDIKGHLAHLINKFYTIDNELLGSYDAEINGFTSKDNKKYKLKIADALGIKNPFH